MIFLWIALFTFWKTGAWLSQSSRSLVVVLVIRTVLSSHPRHPGHLGYPSHPFQFIPVIPVNLVVTVVPVVLVILVRPWVHFFRILLQGQRGGQGNRFNNANNNFARVVRFAFTLDIARRNSSPGELAYNLHSTCNWFRITARKIERTWIHVLRSVFAAVVVLRNAFVDRPCGNVGVDASWVFENVGDWKL